MPKWTSDYLALLAAESAEKLTSGKSAAAETPSGDPESSKGPEGNAAEVAEARHPVVTEPEFCMVVAPDGEWPKLEIFPNAESLAKRFRELEGEAVSVFPFRGIPIPFTSGPVRFLQLPDGQPYPVFDCSQIGTFVPKPDASLPIDTTYSIAPDGMFGEYAVHAVIDHRRASGPKTDKQSGGRSGASSSKRKHDGNRDEAPATNPSAA